jgi:hypothetical protein
VDAGVVAHAPPFAWKVESERKDDDVVNTHISHRKEIRNVV